MTNIRRPYFNNLAAQWDNLPGPPDATDRIRDFVRRSEAGVSPRILDVGCGTGILLPYLREIYPSAGRLVELDLADHMLKLNRAKYPPGGIHHICADAERLPFKYSSFDLVLCFGVFPHFEDKAAALDQMFDVLGNGGIWCLGHIMGSRELNDFHKELSAPVSKDMLPSVEFLTDMLLAAGMKNISAEDNARGYYVRAVKP